MKIFYTSTINGIDEDLDQPCPFHQKTDLGNAIYVGSVSCKKCKYCYGYGQHPGLLHNPVIFPLYSRNTEENRDKIDSELPEYGLSDCKFLSEDDYVKCMKCFSSFGQQLKKNRFKLWYWKHIGEWASDVRYRIIQTYYNIKFRWKKFIS